MSNNVAFSPEIPKNYENKAFEDSLVYLTAYPLCNALVDVAYHFFLQHVCEFYYTSTCDDAKVIVGIIYDGNYTISMTATNIQSDLQLPICDEYFPLPTMVECRVVLEKLDYDF